MLSSYVNYCCPVFILLSLIIWALAGYSYRVNAKRPADDPQRKFFHFHPAAVFLAPLTWPFLLFAWIVFFIFKVLAYSVFLVLFTIALLAFRKPFLLMWLDKIARKVGDILLEVNTFLLK